MKKILISIFVLALTLSSCQNNKSQDQTDQKKDESVQVENKEQKDYKSIGLEYAIGTKAELGKNLMTKMKEDGPIHALEFCNVQAMPITDSMSRKYNADIKRVSDKNRNSANAASEKETDIIKEFSEVIAKGEKPEPIIDEQESQVAFYFPLVTNSMCLKCHGEVGKDISKSDYDKVLELYPEDKAIGYQENEVRGIWRIYFDKE